MQVICAVDEGSQPVIGRATGAWVNPRCDVIEMLVSRWQFPAVADVLARRPEVAVTFMSPWDYVSYQVKGRAVLRTASVEDLAISARYVADTYQLLVSLGLPLNSTSAWLTSRDPVVVTIAVAEVYEQTPGKRAGQPLADQA